MSDAASDQAAPVASLASTRHGEPRRPNPQTMAAAIAAVARLRATFPKAFSSDRPPLRIGIHEEIRARLPEIPADVLNTALALWVSHESYQLSLACRHRRIGLDGKATDVRPTAGMAWDAVLNLSRQLGRKAGTFDPRRLHPLSLWSQSLCNRVAQTDCAETLTGDDLRRALRLLSNHPDVKEKIAGGITAIIVRPVYGGCFFLRRKDGTEDSFSAFRCLGLEPPRAPPPSRRP